MHFEPSNSTQMSNGSVFFCCSNLLNFVTRGPVIAFEMMGAGVISAWRELLGPTDSAEARQVAPQSIRARFGKGVYITKLLHKLYY